MDADLKKRILITIVVFFVLAGIRLGFIFYSRRDTGDAQAKKQQTTYSSNQDDYVTPHKIFPFDFDSAKKELNDKTVWVKTGNQISYYRYDAKAHSVNFAREAGLLPPLAKLQIKDMVLQRAPVKLQPGQVAIVQKQIMIVFEVPGDQGMYAASVGVNTGDDYQFSVNDILLFEDPHELYKHWPSDFWTAIDQHEVKQGMNELQASFALGTNMSVDGGDYGNRTIEFANAGKPVTVTFQKNKAVSVTPGKAQ